MLKLYFTFLMKRHNNYSILVPKCIFSRPY